MYSNRVWITASRWLRVRMWLPRSCFEVAQERDDPLEGEIADRELGDLRALVGGEVHDQQPDRVAVAAHRGWPQAFDGDQVIGEERVQQLPERRWGLIVPSPSRPGGFGERSKRRLASSSSAGVIVR